MDMKERKYVKFRVDMYEDTKFKIIDMHLERDLIHYIWTRLLTLAGKVNLEGSLYLSRNIPYTIETLAIEFNRDVEQVNLALNTLIDLEMLELVKDKIYRVKNFAKHQNIKTKEKVEVQENKVETEGNTQNIKNKEDKSIEKQICEGMEKPPKNQISEDKIINSEIINKDNIDSDCKNSADILINIKDHQPKNDLQSNIPIALEKRKSQKVNKNRAKNISCIDEDSGEIEQDQISGLFEGENGIPLGKEDEVIMTFCV